jgi:hypothetical protein
MARRVEVGVVGVEFDTGPLKAAIEAAAAELQQRVSDAIEGWVGVAERQAAARAPVASGKLQKSIRGTMKTPLRGVVRAHARHAHFRELGTVTRHHPKSGKSLGAVKARPWFVPAMQETRARMWAQLERLIPNKVLV